MSKSKQTSKEPKGNKQGNLFETEGETAGEAAGGTRRKELWMGLQSRLQQQRTLTTDMMQKITDYGTLTKAYQSVKRNKGKAGIDGMSVEEYGQGIAGRIRKLQKELKEGTYEVQAVRGVEIEKPNGGKRILGIPTLTDRIVQQSILQVLQPVYDPYFSENSYGFRPGRSAQQAVEKAAEHVKGGNIWVVDIDLKSFFDEINHERLMSRMSKAMTDKKLLKLIGQYLKAGIMRGGIETQRKAGTPQGGPLSPLLSNIVLDELDRELQARGLSFARYADDCNIFVKSERSARRVLETVTNFIERKLKLKVNRDKSGIRKCDQVKFLGHTIEQNGKIRVADGSIRKFKKKIREVTKRNRGKETNQIIGELNLIIRGWAVYYRRCNTWLSNLRDLDGWIRNRLRCYELKQHQKRYPTWQFLRSLGLEVNKAWNAVMYYSWWPMANLPSVRKAMGLNWFKEKGLQSIEKLQMG